MTDEYQEDMALKALGFALQCQSMSRDIDLVISDAEKVRRYMVDGEVPASAAAKIAAYEARWEALNSAPRS